MTALRNPNAIAAWVASHLVIGVEQIVLRYAGWKLPLFWEQEAIADVTTVVLYIGRSGLKAALSRVGAAMRRVWAGPPTPTPAPPAA